MITSITIPLGLSPAAAFALAAVSFCILTLSLHILYNLYLHPLRQYPGPRLWAATQIPYLRAWLSGRAPFTITDLHNRYGEIVRVAPDRLSYASPQAWHDIRGHRKAGQGENGKDAAFYYTSRHNLLGAGRISHARMRRLLAHGFSAKAMLAQQPLITSYVDLFISRLRDMVRENEGRPTDVNLVAWFNYVTFDVIGDLAFGAPFESLELGREHPWVAAVFNSVEEFGKMVAVRYGAPKLHAHVMPVFAAISGVGKPLQQQAGFAGEQIDKRLALQGRRPDFIDSLLHGAEKEKEKEEKEEGGLSREEIVQNMRLLVLAGSETTATVLSGAAYFLARHGEVQRKLAEEVRGRFKSEDEIDMLSVQGLTYMLAVLDESMRMFPPVPASMPRTCQPGGDVICGLPVPGGTGLDIWPWALNYSTSNFADPEKFIPERWVEEGRDPKFDNDRREALQPFSVGPRNCIGKNLAYVEMRLILARLIWNFDLAVSDDEMWDNWITDSKAYNLWLKDPLPVRLTPASHAPIKQ
ncbi:cytochrome P450 monooxygenase [Cercophora scortea]|uniref:Cytochrome P450 monooxygenase n=1 Tax=Cercophora scortea TaxID=314031 RepID=A0AAE0IXK4_9PEZI|nr:cytochrome P450 monooxygenase [Cercophora scortea]